MKAINFVALNWATCFAAMFALACCCAAFIVALDYFTGTRDLVYAVPIAGTAAMALTFSLLAWRMRKHQNQYSVAANNGRSFFGFGIFNRGTHRQPMPVNQNNNIQGANEVAKATETRAHYIGEDNDINNTMNSRTNETDAQTSANTAVRRRGANVPLRWHSISMSVTRRKANRVRSNS